MIGNRQAAPDHGTHALAKFKFQVCDLVHQFIRSGSTVTWITIALSTALHGVVAANSSIKLGERWKEHAYGVSLQPPADASVFGPISDNTLPWTMGAGTGVAQQPKHWALRSNLQLTRIRSELQKRLNQTTRWPLSLQAQSPAESQNPWADQTNSQLLQELGNRQSITPTATAHLLAHSSSNALLRIEGKPDYSISLHIRRNDRLHTMEKLAQLTNEQIGMRWPSARVLSEDRMKLNNKPTAINCYLIPDNRSGDRIIGHALVQINDERYILMLLQAPYINFDLCKPVFDAVLNSLDIEPTDQIAMRRRASVERAETWSRSLSADSWRSVKQPTQLLHIMQGAYDIGYMRIDMTEATEMKMDGLLITVRGRIYQGKDLHDTHSRFFLSHKQNSEIWAINTTTRFNGLMAKQKPQISAPNVQWAETGIRSRSIIEVSRARPTGTTQRQWQIPPKGYLSLAQLHLIGSLLPRDTGKPLGFYTYLPSANKIVYRTVRTLKMDDGRYRVLTRVNPAHGESTGEYDAQGRLQWLALPGGRVMVVTTPQQFKEIWRNHINQTSG